MAVLNGTTFKVASLAGTAISTETEVTLTVTQSTREVVHKGSNGLRVVAPAVTSISGSFSALLDDGDYDDWQAIAATMTEAAARTTATFTIGHDQDDGGTPPTFTGFRISAPGVLTELSFSAATEENTTVSGSFELNVDSSFTN